MTAFSGTLSYGEMATASTFTCGDGSTTAGALAAVDGCGTFAAAGAVTISAAAAHGGATSLGFDGEYYGKMLVVPREIDCGTVLSDQVHSVEVCNYCTTAKSLSTISVTGDPEVTVADAYGVPTHYACTQSRSYNVTVTALGAPPVIDATANWNFSPALAGTDCVISGIRIILFSPDPNWERGVDETVSYLTDILTSWDGHEQRIQLMEHPRTGISYACLVHGTAEFAYLQSNLFGWGARVWGVPWWPDAVPLAANATAGDTSIYCETSNRSFTAGGMVAVWVSTSSWECLEIATVAADHVTTVTPLLSSWATTSARVVPVRYGKLPMEVDFDLLTTDVSEFDVAFDCSEVER